MFAKKVNLNRRDEMIEFLKGHFRYHTMNSWNLSTSYANCIKVHHLDRPNDVDDDTWWELFSVPQWGDEMNDILQDFGEDHEYQWQIGVNGRSGGYLVLYQGGREPSGDKSYCPKCGQRNFDEATDENRRCGRCKADSRVNFKVQPMQVFTHPGCGTDDKTDFEDWDMSSLRDRVRLVCRFDRTCDQVVERYAEMCRNFKVVQEEILVPKTIRVAKER